MVSQSQRDTTGGWSALGILCRRVRAIAGKNKALAIHTTKSSWTCVPKEPLREYFICWLIKRERNDWSEAIQKPVTDQRTGPAAAHPCPRL